MKKVEVDVEQFARDIKAGKSIGGADGALSSLIKELTETALAAELDSHLADDLSCNRKNGYSSKTMKSDHGSFELDVPRDRNGSYLSNANGKTVSMLAESKKSSCKK